MTIKTPNFAFSTKPSIPLLTLLDKILATSAIIIPLNLTAQRVKVGHVNSQLILDSLPEMKIAKKKIDSMGNAYNQELHQLEYEFQMARNRGDQMAQYQLKIRIGLLKVDIDSEIAAKSDEIFKPIRKKVSDAIATVAKEERYKLILDSRYDAIILYASKRTDLTLEVEKKLGL